MKVYNDNHENVELGIMNGDAVGINLTETEPSGSSKTSWVLFTPDKAREIAAELNRIAAEVDLRKAQAAQPHVFIIGKDKLNDPNAVLGGTVMPVAGSIAPHRNTGHGSSDT